ncbi:MAG: flagellar hook-length control protein FliK [Azoarcus sp.]|jgi:hypothetical protein|nr:flagellar hook-length control protein FliK [Azoarcus sp.]
MIPSDLAARLRFLHEASLFETSQPVAGLQRAREIQTQLQDLVPGQRFLATLQRTLPDGTFRALVAGQQVTLALNASAQPGDTLELIATGVTPKMVLSRLAGTEGAALAGSARSSLSPTGQLISFLLTGQPAARPATLAGDRPFLNAPPTMAGANAQTTASAQAAAGSQIASGAQAASGAQITSGVQAASGSQIAAAVQLAPMLRQALAQSGLFYESHLSQWLAGKIDLATLAREPQARGMAQQLPGQTPPGNAPATPASASAHAGAASSAPTPGGATATANAAAQALARREEPIARIAGVASQATGNDPRGGPIAERLLPIVHQQLEALANQQYVWHGMAWPGQPFEWIIEDPRGGGHADGEEAGGQWHTTLRLTLPRLGGIEASVHLGANGVALRLDVDDEAIAASLERRRDELAGALEAAGVPLTGMVVERRGGR